MGINFQDVSSAIISQGIKENSLSLTDVNLKIENIIGIVGHTGSEMTLSN